MKKLAVLLFVIASQQPNLAVAQNDCDGVFGCADDAQAEELRQIFAAYTEAVSIGELDEAAALAKRVMELSIIINGRHSVHSANALTNLAMVQHKKEEYDIARINYLAAIQTIERVEGALSLDLIRALHRLGETELALGEFDKAKESFRRAVDIGHVTKGPQNIDQIESLEAIAEIQIMSGNYNAALDTQQSIYSYRAREYGHESEEFLPAMEHFAKWMHRLRLYNKERNTYLRMVKIQETHQGKDEISLIPTLITVGASFHQRGFLPNDDRNIARLAGAGPDYYMRRAMRIATEHPDSDWRLRSTTALSVGDYYTRSHRIARAGFIYDEAWQEMSETPDGLRMRDEEFQWPILLEDRRLPEYYEDQYPLYEPESPEGFEHGSITAKFDVTQSGKTVNVKLIETQPPGHTRIEKWLVDTMKYVMHRPRIEDGEQVDTRDIIFVYEYFYRNSDPKDQTTSMNR